MGGIVAKSLRGTVSSDVHLQAVLPDGSTPPNWVHKPNCTQSSTVAPTLTSPQTLASSDDEGARRRPPGEATDSVHITRRRLGMREAEQALSEAVELPALEVCPSPVLGPTASMSPVALRDSSRGGCSRKTGSVTESAAAVVPTLSASAAPFDFGLTEGQTRRSTLQSHELECSQVAPGLFVAGFKVASNRAALRQHGITRVVNCCASIAADYFRTSDGSTSVVSSLSVIPAVVGTGGISCSGGNAGGRWDNEKGDAEEDVRGAELTTASSAVAAVAVARGGAIDKRTTASSENKIVEMIAPASTSVSAADADCIQYLSLCMVDGRDDDITWFAPQVLHFIRGDGEGVGVGATDSKLGNVLVHCEKGVSRSCSFCIAYLMWSQGLPWKQAFSQVKAARDICNPNTYFTVNLIELETQLLVRTDSKLDGTDCFPKASSLAQRPSSLLFRCAVHLPAAHTRDSASVGGPASHDATTPVLKVCRNVASRALVLPTSTAFFDSNGVFVLLQTGGSSTLSPTASSRKAFVWHGKFAAHAVAAVAVQLAQHFRGVYCDAATEFQLVREGAEGADFSAVLAENARFLSLPNCTIAAQDPSAVVRSDLYSLEHLGMAEALRKEREGCVDGSGAHGSDGTLRFLDAVPEITTDKVAANQNAAVDVSALKQHKLASLRQGECSLDDEDVSFSSDADYDEGELWRVRTPSANSSPSNSVHRRVRPQIQSKVPGINLGALMGAVGEAGGAVASFAAVEGVSIKAAIGMQTEAGRSLSPVPGSALLSAGCNAKGTAMPTLAVGTLPAGLGNMESGRSGSDGIASHRISGSHHGSASTLPGIGSTAGSATRVASSNATSALTAHPPSTPPLSRSNSSFMTPTNFVSPALPDNALPSSSGSFMSPDSSSKVAPHTPLTGASILGNASPGGPSIAPLGCSGSGASLHHVHRKLSLSKGESGNAGATTDPNVVPLTATETGGLITTPSPPLKERQPEHGQARSLVATSAAPSFAQGGSGGRPGRMLKVADSRATTITTTAVSTDTPPRNRRPTPPPMLGQCSSSSHIEGSFRSGTIVAGGTGDAAPAARLGAAGRPRSFKDSAANGGSFRSGTILSCGSADVAPAPGLVTSGIQRSFKDPNINAANGSGAPSTVSSSHGNRPSPAPLLIVSSSTHAVSVRSMAVEDLAEEENGGAPESKEPPSQSLPPHNRAVGSHPMSINLAGVAANELAATPNHCVPLAALQLNVAVVQQGSVTQAPTIERGGADQVICSTASIAARERKPRLFVLKRLPGAGPLSRIGDEDEEAKESFGYDDDEADDAYAAGQYNSDDHESAPTTVPTSNGWCLRDLGVYDDDDLEPDMMFLLVAPPEKADAGHPCRCFAWVGADLRRYPDVPADCNGADTMSTAREFFTKREPDLLCQLLDISPPNDWDLSGAVKVTAELDGEESDDFWTLFHSGY